MRAAIAALRGEDIAGKTLGMDADEGRFAAIKLSVNQDDGFFAGIRAFYSLDSKVAEARRQLGASDYTGVAIRRRECECGGAVL